MNEFLYYIRDNLVGTHYFIYAFILYFLMFAIIGYLLKEKYAKYDIKLGAAPVKEKKKKVKKEIQLGKNVVDVKSKAKVPKKSIINSTTIDKISPTIINSTTSIGEVMVNKKETVPGNMDAKSIQQTSVKSQPSSNDTSNSNPIPTPIPNVTPNSNPTPTPMPNVETNSTPATPVNKDLTEPNLSGKIPEL